MDFTMRSLSLGFALLAFAFSPAALADGTPEAPFGWTGLYIGVNVVTAGAELPIT
jgi:hypothetical protein